MTDNNIRAVALFFYYTMPNELLALHATDLAVKKIKPLASQANDSLNPEIVDICTDIASDILKKYKANDKKVTQLQIPKRYENLGNPWVIPTNLSLSPWKEFINITESENLQLLVWTHLLKIEELLVAKKYGISVGTLRYRVSNSLKALGHCVVPSNRRAEI